MNNEYTIKQNIIYIIVTYKNEKFTIKINEEFLPLLKKVETIYIRNSYKKDGIPLKVMGKINGKRISLARILLEVIDSNEKVYIKNNDPLDLRIENLSLGTYSYSNERKENHKQRFHLQKINKENFEKGREIYAKSRFSKEYSDFISNSQLGESNSGAKLSEKIVSEIRNTYFSSNISQKSLSEKYGIPRSTIQDIIEYKTWNTLEENPDKIYRKYKETYLFNIKQNHNESVCTLFNYEKLPYDDFVLNNTLTSEKIFIEKILPQKMYVEVYEYNVFKYSFELYFPSTLSFRNKANFIIISRKPKNIVSRKKIEIVLNQISEFINKKELYI